jgi:hypothetical protein
MTYFLSVWRGAEKKAERNENWIKTDLFGLLQGTISLLSWHPRDIHLMPWLEGNSFRKKNLAGFIISRYRS